MPRARSLKPGFFKNEELAACGFPAMLLFAGLWTIADREGRLEDRPKRIKAEIFPYHSNVSVEKLLSVLEKNGFILRYEVDGVKYIAIPTWKRHQNPHVKEAASTIPAPCSPGASTVQAPEIPERAGLTPDSLNLTPDSGKREPETALPRDALGPVIPIRDAKDAGLLPPAGPAPAEEPAPRDGAMLYLAAYPVQVAQDSACRAYLSVIRTRRQHDELMAGLERHKASTLWRDDAGELNLAEIAKWYPPDRFITRRTYQDHPPPRAKPKESTFRDTMDPEVKRRIAEMRAQGIKPGALQ